MYNEEINSMTRKRVVFEIPVDFNLEELSMEVLDDKGDLQIFDYKEFFEDIFQEAIDKLKNMSSVISAQGVFLSEESERDFQNLLNNKNSSLRFNEPLER